MRILLVEDDPDLTRQLKLALADAGYAVDHAPDGEEAQYLGENEPYDAVILDLGLPKVDGVSVLERWRRGNVTTPVLILTARGAWSDKVAGFDAGADDYLAKPFHTEELLARLRALAAVDQRQARDLTRQVTQAVDVHDGWNRVRFRVRVVAPDADRLLRDIEGAAGVIGDAELCFRRQMQSANDTSVQLAVCGGVEQPLIQLPFVPQREGVERAIATAAMEADALAGIAELERTRVHRRDGAAGVVPREQAKAAGLTIQGDDERARAVLTGVDGIDLTAGNRRDTLTIQPVELQAAQLGVDGDDALGGMGRVAQQGHGVGAALSGWGGCSGD